MYWIKTNTITSTHQIDNAPNIQLNRILQSVVSTDFENVKFAITIAILLSHWTILPRALEVSIRLCNIHFQTDHFGYC